MNLVKTRLTIAFFVNAAGEKVTEPLVIWRSAKPRCFKNVKNRKRSHGIYYYSNQEARMTTEIMTSVLAKINRKMETVKRKNILFMDNAPCHPKCLSDRFSNITVLFLPKNTTSRLQPLDTGIIRNFKVKYGKKLLKFVISRIDNNVKAIDNIQEVDVLKASHGLNLCGGTVSDQIVINCFHNCGFPKECPEVQVLDQEEE